MLAIHAVAHRLVSHNETEVCCVTSGFTSVTDTYVVEILSKINEPFLKKWGIPKTETDYLEVLSNFNERFKVHDNKVVDEINTLCLVRNLALVYKVTEISTILQKVDWLLNDYFMNKYRGQKDSDDVQLLKGTIRETEADRMLTSIGVQEKKIHHLRSHFYKGDYFNPLPTIEDDAKPLYNVLARFQPNYISCALDPEGTGPSTHYKVLQVIAQAVRLTVDHETTSNPKFWGYRNVWHRFRIFESNLFVPVTKEGLESMNRTFLTCYGTQATASFPSPDFDGPFSNLSEKIQTDQLEQLRTILGDNFINTHSNEKVRNAAGFIFLKEMTIEEFLQQCEDLRKITELPSLT